MDDKWTWFSYIWNLCDKLNYTPDEVYKMNFIGTLNWASFFKEKRDHQQKMEDKQKGIKRF